MAQSQQPERGGEAEFIRRIVTDPRNVPDVMRLYGYPGASSEENHDRLYLNSDLSTYVEVPRDAILHRMAVPAEQDPNGAVVLWVRRDAALVYKSAPAAQALAQYFAGAIAGAAGAGGAGAAGAPQFPITQIVYCWPTRFGPACPYPTEICTPASCNPVICGQSPGVQCTHNIACKTPVCTVAEPACQSVHHQVCSAICVVPDAAAAAAAGAGAVAAGPLPSPACTLPQAACPMTLPAQCTAACTPVAACLTPAQTPCHPCVTQQQTPCHPCLTQQQTPCHPCVTQQQTPCHPCLTQQQTPCHPCVTQQQTPCVPCLTQAQTPCHPCVTQQQTPCHPCLTQIASCVPLCTQVGLCRPTLDPACPFPTEICTPRCTVAPGVCGVSGGVFCGPQQSIACGGSAACGPGFGQAAGPAQAAAPFFASRFCSLGVGCDGGGGSQGCFTPGFGCPWTVPPNCPPLSARC
ncbi:MAG TPA: hypothetical protein VHT52_21930 [Stellaceae bacterium]|jgi:hypothetical protein|nr:hypothetical protein [Stellaceae bacterium]